MDNLLTTAILGVVASAAAQFIWEFFGNKKRRTQETTEDRIGRLTKSLHEATSLISNIESEIRARSELADRLQQDIDRYNKLAALHQPEVEAITQLLRGELRKEGRSTFWKGFAINLLFFVLGATASWLITILTR